MWGDSWPTWCSPSYLYIALGSALLSLSLLLCPHLEPCYLNQDPREGGGDGESRGSPRRRQCTMGHHKASSEHISLKKQSFFSTILKVICCLVLSELHKKAM